MKAKMIPTGATESQSAVTKSISWRKRHGRESGPAGDHDQGQAGRSLIPVTSIYAIALKSHDDSEKTFAFSALAAAGRSTSRMAIALGLATLIAAGAPASADEHKIGLAIEWCRRSVGLTPYWSAYIDLIAAYGWTGQKPEAQAALADLEKLKPNYTVDRWRNEGWSDNPVYLAEYQHIIEGLQKAGMRER